MCLFFPDPSHETWKCRFCLVEENSFTHSVYGQYWLFLKIYFQFMYDEFVEDYEPTKADSYRKKVGC